MITKLLVGFLLVLIVASCDPQTQTASSSQSKNSDSATKISGINALLTVEEAESVVAKYYSELNNKAGYPLYRGLFLNVDSIIYSKDSASVEIVASVFGRKRNNQIDTATLGFDIRDTIKAIFNSNNWQLQN